MNQAARRKRALVLVALVFGAVVLALAVWQLVAYGFRGGVVAALIVGSVLVVVTVVSLIETAQQGRR